MAEAVTVALPILDAGPRLAEVLAAVREQRLEEPVELLVADSGSRDGSVEVARRFGAEVLAVAPGTFSHGGTRNLLMERARGRHVAFLTQDAVPASPDWLARLLAAFALADDVALAFGPYRPREGASLPVRRELTEFFAGMSADGTPRVHRRAPGGGRIPTPDTFFTDANGCVARWAWERVPFRAAPYAEDRLLALEMLDAGMAVAYVPAAAVVHSHDYRPVELFRRSFDEFRGLREVYGHVEAFGAGTALRRVGREVAGDVRLAGAEGAGPGRRAGVAVRSARHHALRTIGAALGARADRLPAGVRRRLSLERRASFEPWGAA
jgi:glycosyltransferase involved in cell wall biosynthesis